MTGRKKDGLGIGKNMGKVETPAIWCQFDVYVSVKFAWIQ